ncbi:MAG: hypothetical protein NXH71_03870 [Erythrobacteraceae bacterium]|nr:hypothetical protein [Erythrobacteraceae bacterium]
MISFLPELPAAAGSAPILPPQPGAGGGALGGQARLDFAGLLNIALPAEVELARETGLPEADMAAAPEADLATPAPGAVPLPPMMPDLALAPKPQPEAVPPGTILPESGEPLPQSGEDVPPAAIPAVPQDLSAGGPAIADLATDAPGALSRDSGDQMDMSGLAAGMLTAIPAPAIPAPATALAKALTQAPPTPPSVPPSGLPAALASPAAIRQPGAPRMPAQLAEPVAESVTEGAPASPVSTAPLSDAPEAAGQSAASPASGALAAQPSTPAPGPALSAAVLVAEQRTEQRIAPQQESTILQVGEIREALRAARPEMTLRHAEFGLVSLRIEATGAAQDWRAVLASRDPAFVPAIQTALAERTVAASAETATTGNGAGSGAGQAGSSDQRYGFSPGSGQGSSQPYLSHSGQRDEGASQHQHQQQRQADEAASAAAQDAESPWHHEGGLFA